VTVEGSLISDESALVAALNETFRSGAFRLCKNRSADLEAAIEFRFFEVFDSLIPPRSNTRLFQGSSTVRVLEGGREVSVSTFLSKVACGQEPRALHERIAAFLVHEAAETAGALLEPLVD